jgi:hypothetical protein
VKPIEDQFAPNEDKIEPVREALLRFAPAGWKLPFNRATDALPWNWDLIDLCCFPLSGGVASGGIDSVLDSFARNFKQARDIWAMAPRPAQPKKNLEKVAKAAMALADALDGLDDLSRALLLGDAMCRGPDGWRFPSEIVNPISGERIAIDAGQIPNDWRSIAFAPEIADARDWQEGREFFAPTIARVHALWRIADKEQSGALVDHQDKGGKTTTILSRLAAKPKTDPQIIWGEPESSTNLNFEVSFPADIDPPLVTMALDCFDLIVQTFGFQIAKERITTTTETGMFFGLVSSLFEHAVGGDCPKDTTSFDHEIRKAVAIGRSDLEKLQTLGDHPLAGEIARVNSLKAHEAAPSASMPIKQ